jgi:hypothetical protein
MGLDGMEMEQVLGDGKEMGCPYQRWARCEERGGRRKEDLGEEESTYAMGCKQTVNNGKLGAKGIPSCGWYLIGTTRSGLML